MTAYLAGLGNAPQVHTPNVMDGLSNGGNVKPVLIGDGGGMRNDNPATDRQIFSRNLVNHCETGLDQSKL
jgi:hypothetical protein